MKRVRKFIYIFIALFILFPCLTKAATELSAATQNPVVGEYVYVQLEANYGTNLKIRDFHVYIKFDPEYFSVDSVSWVKLSSNKGTHTIEEDRVYIDKTNGNWGSGPIAQVKFKVLKAGFSEITVERNGESYYTNGDVIAQTMASININSQDPSSDTLIGTLYVEGYDMQPTFSKTVYNYNVIVPSNVSSVNVKATAGNSKQRIEGNGIRKLQYGANKVRVVVTAQDQSSRTYEITIHRTDNRTGDTTLKSLNVSNTPIKYEKGKTVYEATVSKSIDTVMITGRTTDINATLIGTGSKKLNMGLNSFELKVESSGGKESIYYINITRSNEELQTAKKSSKLLSLKVNDIGLDLNNEKNTFLYGITKDITELNINTIPESTTAQTEIIGNENLKPGINIVTIKVTEQLKENEEENTIYKLVVYKNPSKASVISNINAPALKTDIVYTTSSTGVTKIPLDLINTLREYDTKLYYNIVNTSNGLLYQFVIHENLPSSEIDAYITQVNDSPLTYQVELPVGTEITAYVEDYYSSETDVRVYSYTEENKYTLVTAGVKVQNGYITFSTNEDTHYVITTLSLIHEESEFSRLLNKYKGIIIGVILGTIAIIAIAVIINKNNKIKETNEPLY